MVKNEKFVEMVNQIRIRTYQKEFDSENNLFMQIYNRFKDDRSEQYIGSCRCDCNCDGISGCSGDEHVRY